jgi:hypothetical protein
MAHRQENATQAPLLRSRRRESLASTVRPLALSHGPAGGFIEGSSRCIFLVHVCSFFFFLHPTTDIFSIFYIPD